MFGNVHSVSTPPCWTSQAGAEGGLDLERGLKWFLILPKVIFRQRRRGGKAGKGLLSQSVNRLVEGDWGGLLELLEKDCRMLEREDRRNRNRQRRGQRREEVEIEKKRKNSLQRLS